MVWLFDISNFCYFNFLTGLILSDFLSNSLFTPLVFATLFLLSFSDLTASFSTFIFSNSLYLSFSPALQYLAIFSTSCLSMILSIPVSHGLGFTSISVCVLPFFFFSLFPLNIFFISNLIFSNWISSLSSRVLQLLFFTSPLNSFLIVGSSFSPSVLLLFSYSFPDLSFTFTLSFLRFTSLLSILLHPLLPMHHGDFLGFLFQWIFLVLSIFSFSVSFYF